MAEVLDMHEGEKNRCLEAEPAGGGLIPEVENDLQDTPELWRSINLYQRDTASPGGEFHSAAVLYFASFGKKKTETNSSALISTVPRKIA